MKRVQACSCNQPVEARPHEVALVWNHRDANPGRFTWLTLLCARSIQSGVAPPQSKGGVPRRSRTLMVHAACVVAMMLLASCSAQRPATLTTGMALDRAESTLNSTGAREMRVALSPPKSERGGYMMLKCYQLPDGRLVAVVADQKAESAVPTVVGLSFCDTPDKSPAQRVWKVVETLRP
jgi:hypothetical protein